jgi:hypothetical protein
VTPKQKLEKIVEWLDEPNSAPDAAEVDIPKSMIALTAGDLRELYRIVNAAAAAEQTPGENLWRAASKAKRITLMRKMGFGDVMVYADYRWQDFAPHTRADLDRLLTTGKL